jgi:hypothetical protein
VRSLNETESWNSQTYRALVYCASHNTNNFSVGHHGLYSWEKSELYNRLSLLLLLGHQFLETLLFFLQPAFQCPETKLHKLIWEETKCGEFVWRDIVFCFQRWIDNGEENLCTWILCVKDLQQVSMSVCELTQAFRSFLTNTRWPLIAEFRFFPSTYTFTRSPISQPKTKLHKLIWKETKCGEICMERHSILFSKMNW